MDDDPPTLTIAASNDETAIQLQRELEGANWIIRRHTANLLRVMRGAGRPEDLLSDLNELVKTIRSMDNVSIWQFNEHYADVLRDALRQDLDERRVPAARKTIARGVLQMLASELAGHTTQKRRGEHEITEGVREIHDAWEESHRRYREEWTEAHPLKLKPSRRSRATAARKIVAKEAAPTEESEPKGSTAEFMKKRQRELRGG